MKSNWQHVAELMERQRRVVGSHCLWLIATVTTPGGVGWSSSSCSSSGMMEMAVESAPLARSSRLRCGNRDDGFCNRPHRPASLWSSRLGWWPQNAMPVGLVARHHTRCTKVQNIWTDIQGLIKDVIPKLFDEPRRRNEHRAGDACVIRVGTQFRPLYSVCVVVYLGNLCCRQSSGVKPAILK